jgi:hypothetical protein
MAMPRWDFICFVDFPFMLSPQLFTRRAIPVMLTCTSLCASESFIRPWVVTVIWTLLILANVGASVIVAVRSIGEPVASKAAKIGWLAIGITFYTCVYAVPTA